MKKVRKFKSREEAEAHKSLVVSRFKLPTHYTQKDLDDKIVREVGGGRHVPITKIIKEPVPELKYHKASDSWVIEATESEEKDEELSVALEKVEPAELLGHGEAPIAKGGKGLVRDLDTGELVANPKKRSGRREQ